MGKGPKIALGMVLVLLLIVGGVPVIAGLAKEQQTQKAAETGTEKAGADESDGADNAQARPQQGRPEQQRPQPQRQQDPQHWTQKTLAGTAWAIYVPQLGSSITISLNKGGQVEAQTPMGPITGRWKVQGTQLVVSAMGERQTCQIQGWRLRLPQGGFAQRVQ
ncbi:MAG: hypothetical protein ACLFTT_13315 [Candidatus Hydrogenedentota bacterium]